MKDQFEVTWFSAGRVAKYPPNPNFPNGIDVNVGLGQNAVCKVDIPYPAPQCGHYLVRCRLCYMTIAITAAGRPDDPKSLTMPCNLPILKEEENA